MSGQATEAAERSFHEIVAPGDTCFMCGQEWGRTKCSYAARIIPGAGLIQVCSAECAAQPRFADPFAAMLAKKESAGA